MERVDAPRRLSGVGLSFLVGVASFSRSRRFAAARLYPFGKKRKNERTWNKSQERGPSERGREEEPGKWDCKSGGQTHYKFITGFPRRATLLRIRAKSPTQNLLHTRDTRHESDESREQRKIEREDGRETGGGR